MGVFYNQLILPGGRCLPDEEVSILQVTVDRSVSEGEQLLPGGVCAAKLEARLLDPGQRLACKAGDSILLRHALENGEILAQGVFYLEKPTRPQGDILVLTGYDEVRKLDRELTGWLEELTEWPYTLEEFARMVAGACGLTLDTEGFVNGQLPVEKFSATVTGKQLMRWICQVGCRFCVAKPQGGLRLGWFEETDRVLAPTGEDFYYRNGLCYEDETTAEIDGVQIRLPDGKSSYLWPASNGENPWILTGNPFLRQVTQQTQEALARIREQLRGLVYTPCTVKLPADSEILPGQILWVDTPKGKRIRVCVLESQCDGQRMILRASGEVKLRNTLTAGERAELNVQNQVAGQTQQDIFNKLTDGGKIQGIFMENGQLYIHADYLKSGKVSAELIDVDNLIARKLLSASGDGKMQIDSAQLLFYHNDQTVIEMYTEDGMPILYMFDRENGNITGTAELSAHHLKVGGSSQEPAFYVIGNAAGCKLAINGGTPKTLFWYDHGDGSFSLRGR